MARGWAVVVLAVLTVPLVGCTTTGTAGAAGAGGARMDASVEAAYGFLDAMLDRAGTGDEPRLPQSYTGGTLEAEGYTSSTTYDDALVVDALLARGTDDDVRRARVVGDALRTAQQRDPAEDGRLRASYAPGPVPATGPVQPTNPTSDVGAMAWAGRAMLHLFERTQDKSYLDSARRIATWIQDNAHDTRGAGGYTGGQSADDEPLRWKSTEHNLDLVSLFTALAAATGDAAWSDRAGQAAGFVRSQYDEAGHRFATGTELDGVTVNRAFIPADAQTWSYLVLRDPHFAASLDYAATAMAARDGPYTGISATADERSGVWFEGTSHLALALRLRGGPDDATRADTYLDSVRQSQRDGGIPAASRDTPPNAQGVRLYASLHTGTTAWYALAAQTHNPF